MHGKPDVILNAYHQEVTGSRNLLVYENSYGEKYKILIDCGSFMEKRWNFLNFVDDFDYSEIDAIILTHNHQDHSGLIPKAVRGGFSGPIYLTEKTNFLVKDYWMNSVKIHKENVQWMRKKFPTAKHRIHELYDVEDVERACMQCESIPYRHTKEIFPGIKICLYENAHIVGAAMVFIECYAPNKKSYNYLFTGDINFRNSFEEVKILPKYIFEKELSLIIESTYGDTNRADIEQCLVQNLLRAFSKRMHILLPVLAQGRKQEILYILKILQDKGLIPKEYQIIIDGPLGIATCKKYMDLTNVDFMPDGIIYADPAARKTLLKGKRPTIVVTTSGMISKGPAQDYLSSCIEDENTMVHITCYPAENTLARELINTKYGEKIKIGSNVYTKKAEICHTSECSSHATADEIIAFIQQFTNVRMCLINHGDADVQEEFMERVSKECSNIHQIGLLNRSTMYMFTQRMIPGSNYKVLDVKKRYSKICSDPVKYFGTMVSDEEIKGVAKAQTDYRKKKSSVGKKINCKGKYIRLKHRTKYRSYKR